MSAKTKIIVLHMKELVYTLVFAALAVVLIVLLIVMFRPSEQEEAKEAALYEPGVYTAAAAINNTTFEVQVVVDEERIKSINFVNLADSVTTMYPLATTTMEELEAQILSSQSLEDISYDSDNQYTTLVLVEAIEEALEKAMIDS